MITLTTPLLNGSFLSHTLTVTTLDPNALIGLTVAKTRKDGYTAGRCIMAVYPVAVDADRLDEKLVIPFIENGIYQASDGRRYQIAHRKA